MDSNVIFKIIPLRLELNQNNRLMNGVEFASYIDKKRSMSRFLFNDLRNMSEEERSIYLERIDLSDLFIRVEEGQVFYDESELDRLK